MMDESGNTRDDMFLPTGTDESDKLAEIMKEHWANDKEMAVTVVKVRCLFSSICQSVGFVSCWRSRCNERSFFGGGWRAPTGPYAPCVCFRPGLAFPLHASDSGLRHFCSTRAVLSLYQQTWIMRNCIVG